MRGEESDTGFDPGIGGGFSATFACSTRARPNPDALRASVARITGLADAAVRPAGDAPGRGVVSTVVADTRSRVIIHTSLDAGSAGAFDGWLEIVEKEVRGLTWPVTMSRLRRPRRIPDLLDWLDLPAALTAFVIFEADHTTQVSAEYPEAAVRGLADDLSRWCTMPGGHMIVARDQDDCWSTPDAAAADLFADEAGPITRRLMSISLHPKRMRQVHLGLRAEAELQIVADPLEHSEHLEDLLDAMALLAPHVSYAFVRKGLPVIPSHQDVSQALHRTATLGESALASGLGQHLLTSYVPDVYVAQILTDAHMRKLPTLDAFEIRAVGPDRFLVAAKDPGPWLTELNPDERVLARERGNFGPIIMTERVLDANPPLWSSARA